MDPVCEKVGDESMRLAAEEERLLSYDAGNEPTEDGRYPIPVSFDTQWLKPGRAHTSNAPDGYGVGIGGHTRKVVMTDYRTKVGVLKNHIGSSGSMDANHGRKCLPEVGIGSRRLRERIMHGFGRPIAALAAHFWLLRSVRLEYAAPHGLEVITLLPLRHCDGERRRGPVVQSEVTDEFKVFIHDASNVLGKVGDRKDEACAR